MPERIIDCCTLLNLYVGWGGLTELAEFDVSWGISKAVFKESEYVREYDSTSGNIITLPLDLDGAVKAGLLSIISAESEQERLDYVEFATELDDGEAESLALAKNRQLILVTVDQKSLHVARRPDVNVEPLTTVSVLQEWEKINRTNSKRLKVVVNRIRYLARFHPPPGSPNRAWWDTFVDEK